MRTHISIKKGIVCDLDGTLASSKAPMDAEMAELIAKLLPRYHFAVLGGGKPDLFFSQVVEPLAAIKGAKEFFPRLALLPTSGACGYLYDKKWKRAYAESMTPKEVRAIRASFQKAFEGTGYAHPRTIHGPLIENRTTAVVFSAVGHEAPLRAKEAWNKKNDRRPELRQTLAPLLPEHEVKIGGLTSIDVTRKGVDKAFGIEKIKEFFSLRTEDMIFLGDALFPGGNDEPVKRSGVETISVQSPEDTKRIFKRWLAA